MSLDGGEWPLGDGQNISDAYCLIPTTRILATFQLVAVNVGSGGVGHSGLRNRWGGCLKRHGVYIWMCIYHEFSLEARSQQQSSRSDGTHVKNVKNTVKLQPPGSDCLFIILRVVMSRDRVPFTSLNNVPLDLVHSSTIQSLVRKSHGVRIADSTYVVNLSIASRTD